MKRNNILSALAAFAALVWLSFGVVACRSDDDDTNPSGGGTTYEEASAEEKAKFTVSYDAESLTSLSHYEESIEQAITITTDVPWYFVCEDTWALLSTQSSDSTETNTVAITLTTEDNLAEYHIAGDEPSDRTTVLHLLSRASGKQICAITLTQTGVLIDGVQGNNTFMGCGYDVYTARWANARDVKGAKIFSENKITAEETRSGDTLSFSMIDTSTETKAYTGSSISELVNSMVTSVGVELGAYGFSGQVKQSFGETYTTTNEESYAITSFKARTGKYWYDSSVVDYATSKNSSGGYENKYLTDAAFKAIYGIDENKKYAGATGIKNLIAAYGTHVIVSGVMGGRLDYSMRINKSMIGTEYTLENYAKAGYKGKVEASIDVDNKYAQKLSTSTSQYSDSMTSIGGGTDTSTEAIWKASLTQENAALMDFDIMSAQSRSLVPIWELCKDVERAMAIKNYVEKEYSFRNICETSVGLLVLTDGRLVSAASYDANSDASVAGIIAYIGNEHHGEPNTAYMLGTQQGENLVWTLTSTAGYDTMVNTGYTIGNKAWSIVQAADPTGTANAATNYPLFNYANTYGTLAGLNGTPFADGWFVPSIFELQTIACNNTVLHQSLVKIGAAPIYQKFYISSSQSIHKNYVYGVSVNSDSFSAAPQKKDEFTTSQGTAKVCVVHAIPIQ